MTPQIRSGIQIVLLLINIFVIFFDVYYCKLWEYFYYIIINDSIMYICAIYTLICELYVQIRRIRKKLFDGYIRRLKFKYYRVVLIIIFFICVSIHISLLLRINYKQSLISYIVHAVTLIQMGWILFKLSRQKNKEKKLNQLQDLMMARQHSPFLQVPHSDIRVNIEISQSCLICLICQYNIEPQQILVIFRCGHYFHLSEGCFRLTVFNDNGYILCVVCKEIIYFDDLQITQLKQ
ncbi:hypothetical protein pb186bvf_012043 [Paramecium bursaria]